jgi:hypothetical protein
MSPPGGSEPISEIGQGLETMRRRALSGRCPHGWSEMLLSLDSHDPAPAEVERLDGVSQDDLINPLTALSLYLSAAKGLLRATAEPDRQALWCAITGAQQALRAVARDPGLCGSGS